MPRFKPEPHPEAASNADMETGPRTTEESMRTKLIETGIGTVASIAGFLMLAGISPGFADDDFSPSPVTWAQDVAPILYQNCTSCHRPGEIGPMSLMNYREVRPWAKSIKKEVVERTMPPWHADSKQVSYTNDRRLNEQDIDTIVAWVDSGAKGGNLLDAPPQPDYSSGWVMGKPDMIFHATRDVHLPANADEKDIGYQSVIFDTSALTEDIYIRGWEIRGTETGVVHHANLVLSPRPFIEGRTDIFRQAAVPGGDYVGSFIPGCRPMMYPEGTAYKLPVGSSLAIQVHYIGKDYETSDHLMFGIRFAEGRVDKRVRVVGLLNVDGGLNIPPQTPDYVLAAEATLLFDTLILSSGAHMHLRGWSYRQTNVLPDGSEKLVTEVPRYDFNWQSTYWLEEPIFAPKGSAIRTVAHYNNTAENENVTRPDLAAKYGPWTQDEMLNAWSHCVKADEKLGLKIENGRVIGKFDDAQDKPHPFLLQALTSRILSQDGKYEERELLTGLNEDTLNRIEKNLGGEL